jgi:hypothetical protein
MANLNFSRLGHAAVVLGGALYVIGGHSGWTAGSTASVERYDPDQNKWVAVAPMTVARNGAAAAVLNGRIVAAGGYNNGIGILQSCESYDPDQNKWEALPDMATARSGSAVTVLGGRLWLTGGGVGTAATTVEVFDPATKVWDQTKAPMTTGRRHHALAVLFGELHAIGGSKETSVEKYDAQADLWALVPAMALPEKRRGTAWAVLDVPWRKMPKKALKHKKRRRPLPTAAEIAALRAAQAAPAPPEAAEVIERAKEAAKVIETIRAPTYTLIRMRPEEKASYAHHL